MSYVARRGSLADFDPAGGGRLIKYMTSGTWSNAEILRARRHVSVPE